MATKPHRFEQLAVITRELHKGLPFRLRPDFSGDFVDAKIVSGGQWLVTLSIEWDESWEPPWQSFVRFWQIAHPVQKNFKCVAKMKLPDNHTPHEARLQPGDGHLDLLVFVSTFQTGRPHDGGYIQVLRITLAAEDPQFSLVAELGTDKCCTGMRLQHGNVVAGFYVPGVNRTEAFVWNWKNGAKVEVSSPEGGKNWFLVVSETISILWNANNRYIEVHWSTKSERPDEEHRYLPLPPDTFSDPQVLQAIFPFTDECRKSFGYPYQVALAHLEHETLRIEIDNLGAGRVSFTRYPKDNTYMQNPNDPDDPFGSDSEVPKSFVQTVKGHLVDMSSSGRLTAYFASDSEGDTKIGESISYVAFTNLNSRDPEPHFPFLCPFSGVAGSVSESGDFYIWEVR
ncbi:hypothetical protein M407DRAFT_26649 [Tulasnella calospora MUT 4182]|uniref:Uncharacterized protein n=1 Tax=Tulasnella calospora MUT 4182 TaxID=1051891 RepID=A0A0C3QFE1_9AGAM|nr:hypothetical protein M407DRAFT_26649 [Tulasnella calospora MUT 4182]